MVVVKNPKLAIDTNIFRNTERTIFEALVVFLKDQKKMNYHDIGVLLDRDERNVWTVYNRGKKKK